MLRRQKLLQRKLHKFQVTPSLKGIIATNVTSAMTADNLFAATIVPKVIDFSFYHFIHPDLFLTTHISSLKRPHCYCHKAFHLKCHIPPLNEVPEGDWRCCECTAVREQSISQESAPKGKSRTRQCASKALNIEEEATKPSYNEDDYNFLWNYYLHPVKRSKEELPGGMVLRTKSVQCNLLRYSKCQFRRTLFKKIQRLKRDNKNDEIYRMLQMLHKHDVSGAAGDGPEELIAKILERSNTDDNDDDVEYINTDKEVEVIDVSGESGSSQVAAANNSTLTNNAKVKMESDDDVKPSGSEEMDCRIAANRNQNKPRETSNKEKHSAVCPNDE